MAKSRTTQRLSQLWQFPLLVVSLGLFAVAAYLLINPHRYRPTIDDKIAVAANYLKQDRPGAALEQLNRLLQTETLAQDKEAKIHIMLGQAIEAGQANLKISIPENYRRIIEQTRLGLTEGAPADATIHRRLADSYAALELTEPAVAHYRKAIAMDPDHALDIRRKMIELLLAEDEPDEASNAIDEYLSQKDLASAERSWALGQKADLLIDLRQFAGAHAMLAQAVKLTPDPVEQGQFNYQLGYCIWKEGDDKEAERYLRLSRDQMKSSHPLDGDAAYVLGRIYQDRGDPTTAASFYEVTLVSHPDSRMAPLALLGRGMSRLLLNQTDAGLSDLHDLTTELGRKTHRSSVVIEAIRGLQKSSALLSDKQNYQGALEVLAYEQQLTGVATADFYSRLAVVYESRANQLADLLKDAALSETDKARINEQIRDSRSRAGDAYVANSRALTMLDDNAYGDALWHGIDLYDQAGNLQRVISALELFISERPQDKLTPDALLRLGRAYQAAGMFDKAIDTFRHNQFRYPNSLAASKSAVPLAESYMARGPDDYPKAEKVLLAVVEDNDQVDPSAEEFHQSLFELAQLYYRTDRYEDAIARLEEMVQRYPTDMQLPQLTFLMADSYRKSAQLLEEKQATTKPSLQDPSVAIELRQRRTKARQLFDKVLDLYATAPPASDVDKLYQKLSNFYRADCMYDLGSYEQAIKLYDQAAFRYQNEPEALAAYVQIVNSYCALGRPDDARTANERAKWILRRMPPQAFDDGTFPMSKKYWDDWLKWTSQSGVF